MYNKTIITFGFYDIQNTQGESVRVISRGRRLRLITPVPRVILVSQKPHPIIVY